MTRARRSIGVLAAGGIAVVLTAMPIAFGLREARSRATNTATRAPAALPLPATQLPKRITKLSRSTQVAERARAGSPEETWSRIASSAWCGGSDVFSVAVDVAAQRSKADELVRVLSIPAGDLRATLTCGKELERFMGAGTSSYSIEFESSDGDAPRVSLESLPIEELPRTASFVRPVALPKALEKGRCVVGPRAHAGASCLPTASTAARVRGTRLWVTGKLVDVQAFAKELEAGGRSEDAERLEPLGKELVGFPVTEVRRDGRDFRKALFYELFTLPFPYMSMNKLATALDEALLAGFWVGAISHRQEPEKLSVEIEGTHEGEAAKIEAALREYVSAVGGRLRGDLPATLAHGDESEHELARAARERRAKRRAWQTATISRQRTRVRLETSLELDADGKASEARYRQWIEPKRAVAVRLVREVIAGHALPRVDLELLAGPNFMARLERGDRPYFEGDWRCPTQDGGTRYFSFDAGRAYRDEGRKTPKGEYTYQLHAEWSGELPAEVRVASETWHVKPAFRGALFGITIHAAPEPELECTRLGETPNEPEPPKAIQLDLPKPVEGQTYTPIDLERLGLRIERIDATRSLVCGFDPGHCICFEPLPCEAKGDCPTFDENIAIFEKALQPGQERTVRCERATSGRAGDFRFFDFVGDIHRHEVRWFDASGRLVGQRNVTDYPEYCDHRTSGRWRGRVPAADSTVRERVICGKVKTTLMPPLEDLRELLGTGLLLGG